MKKMILQIQPHAGEMPHHVVVEKLPVTIGRAFDNDVIISDPHVEPHHLTITSDWKVGGKKIKSGDTITLGLTEIRVYAPDHKVPPALTREKETPLPAWISRAGTAWGCFALSVIAAFLWARFTIWSEQPNMVTATAVSGNIGVIVAWTALWAAAGKLIRHQPQVRGHATAVSLYMLGGVVLWYISAYADFLLNENTVANAINFIGNVVLLTGLLCASLAFATHLGTKRRTVMAAVISTAIMGGAFAFDAVSAKEFDQRPLYPRTMQPYLASLAAAQDIKTFISGSASLFEEKK